jgi:Ca-activated chloride channel family protein
MLAYNPYTLLGVAPTASQGEIKAAFRRIAQRLHPDRNHHPGAAVQLQDINQAHELLLDAAQRSRIDRLIREQNLEKQPEFILRVTPSKRHVQSFPDPQVIYLLTEVYASSQTSGEDMEKRQREARLNLTLMIDRSNSMNGSRLERVKNAANKIIEQLKPSDIFSVVAFNDFAEVIFNAAPAQSPAIIKAHISMIGASGGTEMFRGLELAAQQNRLNRQAERVNHIILLTDGNTFGDEARCVNLARELAAEGIGISALGIGHEWNDNFLDEVASITGGTSEYAQNVTSIERFLNDHIRGLANTFAERLVISLAPDPDVAIEYIFRLAPRPQPLPLDSAAIALGTLQYQRVTSVIFQLELPGGLTPGFRSLARIAVQGDVLAGGVHPCTTVSDISLRISAEEEADEPPANVLDALSKLALYRMQERARLALESGDVKEATRLLHNLGTRLLEEGEENLANQAFNEARQVSQTKALSESGQKALKYHTRSLLLPSGSESRQ